jgi:hypothetical protein
VLAAAWITAAATALLAAFAVVTAWYARRAFYGQAEELGVLQRQAKSTADMLEEQKNVNSKQTAVLELQAQELSESLAERKRQAEEKRRTQASQVAAWFGLGEITSRPDVCLVRPEAVWGAFIRNESALPVLSVRVFFHYIHAETPVSENWTTRMRGGPVSVIRVLPARSERFVEIPGSVRDMIRECDESTYAVSLEFIDTDGIRWQRDARGALSER